MVGVVWRHDQDEMSRLRKANGKGLDRTDHFRLSEQTQVKKIVVINTLKNSYKRITFTFKKINEEYEKCCCPLMHAC